MSAVAYVLGPIRNGPYLRVSKNGLVHTASLYGPYVRVVRIGL